MHGQQNFLGISPLDIHTVFSYSGINFRKSSVLLNTSVCGANKSYVDCHEVCHSASYIYMVYHK